MASKALSLNVAGTDIAAAIESKVGKDDLYGRVVHIVEQDGRPMERGWLLPDGSMFRKSQVAMTSADPDGSPAESPEMQCAGQKVELRPSSFDAGECLEPVPLETIARMVTSDVYPLEAPGLYRKSARPRDALVVVRDDGAFLLVGNLRACPLVGRTVAYDFFDAADAAADEAGDPLDFSMM